MLAGRRYVEMFAEQDVYRTPSSFQQEGEPIRVRVWDGRLGEVTRAAPSWPRRTPLQAGSVLLSFQRSSAPDAADFNSHWKVGHSA